MDGSLDVRRRPAKGQRPRRSRRACPLRTRPLSVLLTARGGVRPPQATPTPFTALCFVGCHPTSTKRAGRQRRGGQEIQCQYGQSLFWAFRTHDRGRGGSRRLGLFGWHLPCNSDPEEGRGQAPPDRGREVSGGAQESGGRVMEDRLRHVEFKRPGSEAVARLSLGRLPSRVGVLKPHVDGAAVRRTVCG
jgi:hypothetical protein